MIDHIDPLVSIPLAVVLWVTLAVVERRAQRKEQQR